MKKLFAVLLALIMALGCVGAAAEEFVPQATSTEIRMTVDHEFVGSMIPMMTGADLDAKYVEAILGILETAYADITAGGNAADITLKANDQVLCSLKGAMDEDGVVLVGDIFPHYAVRITAEDIENLMKQLPVSDVSELLSEEALAEIMADLQNYGEDFTAFMNTLSESAEVSEDGNTVVLNVTAHQLSSLADALVTRLSADEVLRPYIEKILEQANAQQEEGAEPVTLEALLEQARQYVQQISEAEDQVVATIAVTNSEDGANILATIANVAQIKVDAAGSTVDVRVLGSQAGLEEGGDWEALYNGLVTGSNYEDFATLVHFEMDYADDVQSTYASTQILSGGMNITISALNKVKGEGTPDYFAYCNAGIDLGMTEGDVVQFELTSTYADAPAIPALEGLTVIDPFQAGEEETQGLLNDVMTYGLNTLMSGAMQAMPDEMAAVTELFMSSSEGAIEEGETVPGYQ
ncbi:MAG: hypothetical protein J5564_08330 [Clostridia bacterium]|nr:hypothetical protein [Clostridia bacterium]